MFMKNPKKSFTLAEVLLTLVIIGILAAMTVPNMIYSYQKTAWVTGLKKAYVTWNQVLQRAAMEECGTMDLACVFDGKTNLQIGEVLLKYFSISQNCQVDYIPENSDNGCWATFNTSIDGTYSSYYDWDHYYHYKFISADEMSVSFDSYNSLKNIGISEDSPTYKTWGYIYFDVNGKKAPNRLGRDVFRFWITSNKMPLLYPSGGKDDNEAQTEGVDKTTGGSSWWKYNNQLSCDLSADKAGWHCAGRIMENGWQMDY